MAITTGGVMCNFRTVWFVSNVIAFFAGCFGIAAAITLPDLASRVQNMGRVEREVLLVKGAKEEKEAMFYGTTPVNQLAVLKKAFSARYPFVDLKHYYSPRQGILNKTMSEARGGANIVDVIMTDLSYGSLFIKEGVSHPYTTPDLKRYVGGSYDPDGHVYKWKGIMLFDPEAAYIMAAMEQAWGREKARDYLARLAKQNLIFRRGTTLTTQLIAAGEQPIAIAVNAETAAEVRDKGAPLGFSVLSPRIIKPNGFFVAKKAPHPHAALLFTDWTLSEEGQKVLAVELGKGVAMKGVPVKHKEFQSEPDFVVAPEFGSKLKQHMMEFQKIFGL